VEFPTEPEIDPEAELPVAAAQELLPERSELLQVALQDSLALAAAAGVVLAWLACLEDQPLVASYHMAQAVELVPALEV